MESLQFEQCFLLTASQADLRKGRVEAPVLLEASPFLFQSLWLESRNRAPR